MSLNSLARTQNFINQMNKQAKAKAINRECETAAAKDEKTQAALKEKVLAFTIAEQKELFNIAANNPMQKLDEALKFKTHEIDAKKAEKG